MLLLFVMPHSAWEFDEPLFFQALHEYDPRAHHPPPPGYPVFMGVAKAVRLIVPDDFQTLRAISVGSSAIGFVMLALAFGRIAGSRLAGLAGSAFFYLSPALLVHSTLPVSEAGALALLATALCFGSGVWFAVFCALAIGWRIQFTIFVLPLFFASLALHRRRFAVLAAFTITCLLWFVPLAMQVGGFESLYRLETKQATYLGEHDADVSRSGWTFPAIALRFIAHPWGMKVASFPLLIVAAIGAAALVRARRREAIPIAVAGLAYIAFALAVMDPADGVRYAIPFVLVVGGAAGMGAWWLAPRMRMPVAAMLALFAGGSLVYCSSLLSQRGSSTSPPVRAAEFARKTFPPKSVAIYELPLWPHAMYWFGGFTALRFDEGMTRAYERPDVPMFAYVDGASREPGAVVFRWAPSDAYSKLTRNHYRVASVIPIPPEARFRVLRGVYGPEREPDGLAWRWLAPVADIQLPTGPPRDATIRLGLPEAAHIETNSVAISVDGAPAGTFRVARGRETVAVVRVPAGAPRLTFRSEIAFVPAEVPGSLNRDPRTLAVKLYGLKTHPVAAAPAVQAAASR